MTMTIRHSISFVRNWSFAPAAAVILCLFAPSAHSQQSFKTPDEAAAALAAAVKSGKQRDILKVLGSDGKDIVSSGKRLAFETVAGDIVGMSMSHDDASDFRPRPGRIRDPGARVGRQPRSFVTQVMKAAAKANGGPLTSTQLNGRSRNSSA
jgi:hypothetical protein